MTNIYMLSLLENAFDYLLMAAEQVKLGCGETSSFGLIQPGLTAPKDIKKRMRLFKYAVINLAIGIELLLKTRLKQEHWSLIFENVDKSKVADLNSGDFKSVDFTTAIIRLRNICGIDIPQSEEKVLRSVRDSRNRVVHYDVEINERQIKVLMAKAYNLAINFYHNHLEIYGKIGDDIIKELHKDLNEFDEYVTKRFMAIQHKLTTAPHNVAGKELECSNVINCPHCYQPALILGDGTPRCEFCVHIFDEHTLAEILNTEVDEIRECDNCHQMTCFLNIVNNDLTVWQCTSCGFQF